MPPYTLQEWGGTSVWREQFKEQILHLFSGNE